jgi:ABC-2 type transport system permease protein
MFVMNRIKTMISRLKSDPNKLALSGEMYEPGVSRGMVDALNNMFLLNLIVKKEVKVRYRDSFLGMVWTYIKPAVSFGVYFFFVGYALGQHHIPAYAVYLYSGMVIMQLFNETFRNCTNSIRNNAALVRKIYLPRELFPLASWRVALVHFSPQVAILVVLCVFFKWIPDAKSIFAFCFAVAIISTCAIGLGMIFATMNVFFKDSENLADLITSISTWFSPVIYMTTAIKGIVPPWLYTIYCLNPATAAVNLFHYAFWREAAHPDPIAYPNPPHLFEFASVSFAFSLFVLFLGQMIFRRFEGRFAQEL